MQSYRQFAIRPTMKETEVTPDVERMHPVGPLSVFFSVYRGLGSGKEHRFNVLSVLRAG